MVALSSYNDYLNRATSGYEVQRHFGAELAATATNLTGGALIMAKSPPIYTVETMPSGVTGFRLTNATVYPSILTGFILLAKLIDMGTFVAGTGFTDGAAMPTVTEGNTSRQIHSALLLEVVTAGAGALSLTIDYTDQDGVASTTPAQALTAAASAFSCGFFPLATGDYGARDVTNITRTSGTGTGTFKVWGVIPMGYFNTSSAQSGLAYNLNFLTDYPTPPLLNAGDSLYLISSPGTARGFKGVLSFVGEQA